MIADWKFLDLKASIDPQKAPQKALRKLSNRHSPKPPKKPENEAIEKPTNFGR
jgi:hypothetical protein